MGNELNSIFFILPRRRRRTCNTPIEYSRITLYREEEEENKNTGTKIYALDRLNVKITHQATPGPNPMIVGFARAGAPSLIYSRFGCSCYWGISVSIVHSDELETKKKEKQQAPMAKSITQKETDELLIIITELAAAFLLLRLLSRESATDEFVQSQRRHASIFLALLGDPRLAPLFRFV